MGVTMFMRRVRSFQSRPIIRPSLTPFNQKTIRKVQNAEIKIGYSSF